MWLLFRDQNAAAQRLLQCGAAIPVLYAAAAVSLNILQGIGKLKESVLHSAIALGAELAGLFLCLKFTNLQIYSLLAAMFLFGAMATILNCTALYRYGCLRGKIGKVFLRPAVFGLFFLAVFRYILDCF